MTHKLEESAREIAAALDEAVSASLFDARLDRAREAAATIVGDPLHRVILQLSVGLDEIGILVTAISSKGKAELFNVSFARDDDTADALAADEARRAAERAAKERAPRAPYQRTGKYARQEDEPGRGLDLPGSFFGGGGASDDDD